MAVDANFASLLEKLKVEDPWLPPRTWESIPSQSGQPPLRRPHRSDSSSSSVSEASLVRLALNALQGVESALISIEKLSAAFCYDAADRTFHQIPSLWNRSSSTHALGKILESIGYSGFSVFLLRKFVEYFVNLNMNDGFSGGESGRNSLVNQAFAVAVGKVLEGYICALDRLHASVGLRRSSKSVEAPSFFPSGCLTSVVHSEFTFLEVYLHTKELRTQIEALASICNLQRIAHCFATSSFEELITDAISTFRDFYRGADLLSYLYAKLKVADPTHSTLLKYLFLRSSEPYCGFIRSWIFKAEISDPYKEFVVEYAGSLEHDQNVKSGVSIDSPVASIKEFNGAAVPCFLKDYLIPLVRAGQQLQVLMKLFEICKYVTRGTDTYMNFLPCWSEFSGNHSIYASPITFSKGNIEALVLTRKSYYERMQEKFGTLLTKLELSYPEVLSHGTIPLFFGNISAGLNTTLSFTVEDEILVPSRLDQSHSNVVIDDYDFEGEFSPMMDSDSSECSSTSSFEEQTELTELNKCPDILAGPKNTYFSALKFSSSTAVQNENSCLMESDSDGMLKKADVHGHFMDSQHAGTLTNHLSLPLELGEPNWSCSNLHRADSVFGRSWPVGSLLKNPFYVETNEIDARLHSPGSTTEMSNGVANVSNDVLSYLCKSISRSDDLKLEKSVEDQADKGPTSDLFALQHWKHGCDSNYLSKNPMLAKSSFLASNLCGIPSPKPFPFFDFSSVSDPCKVYVEKVTADFTPEILGNHSSSLMRDKRNQQNTEGCGGNSIVIGKSKASDGHSPPELKNQNQEAGTLTTVSGGSGWQSLLSSSSISCSSKVGDHQQDPPITFEMPLDFVLDKCLLQEILLQYNYVSRLTIKMLEEGFNLQEHLLALRRYHFMELGDWADLFILSLWNHKWSATDANKRVPEIQVLLELSIQRSSCERDHNKDRLFVYTKGPGMMPLSTSTVGVHSFDFLGLGYRVDWPVNIILTPAALRIYADIFSFLIQLKLANFSLTDVWCSVKDMIHLSGKDSNSALDKHEVAKFNMLMKLRHQVNHFVSTLQQYVQSQLSHISWCRFIHSFKTKVKDMMDLETVHMAYLTDSLHICFLSEETRPVAVILENILQCALDFRSCLSGNMWDIRLGVGDMHDKLSRINVSQVLAIKQKFDKNLKELHLCYLKSPKHGDFGLSCFWGFLNYNNYYSDGNEVRRSAFSV